MQAMLPEERDRLLASRKASERNRPEDSRAVAKEPFEHGSISLAPQLQPRLSQKTGLRDARPTARSHSVQGVGPASASSCRSQLHSACTGVRHCLFELLLCNRSGTCSARQ